jgi:antitoxin VapB
MALIIEDPELDQKIHTVAHALGKSVEETIWMALDRIDLPTAVSEQDAIGREIDWQEVRRILARVDAMPVLDHRTADEIIGYNEHGHFD